MLDRVEAIVTKSPRHIYQSGMQARFMRLDSTWGFKFYNYEDDRDKTFDLQSLAAEHDCAPRLGDKFSFKTPDGDTVFGYVTECVTKLGNDIYREECNDNFYGDYEDASEEDMMEISDYNNLIFDLESIMRVYDMHGGNVGRLNNGRMVAIDFDGCKPFK